MRGLAIALLLIAIPAAAQPPPPPLAPVGPVGEPAAAPRARIDVGLLAGLGQDDLDEADTSPGIRAGFSYMIAPQFGIMAAGRYISIRADAFDDSNVDATYWDLDFGVRAQVPVGPTATVFGEAFATYATLEFSGEGGSIDGADVGFGARAGGMFSTGGSIALGAAVTYSTATIDVEQVGEADAAWLALEAFVSFGF